MRISGDATGTALRVDDKEVELSGPALTISVDPGTHQVTLDRNGTEVAHKTAEVGGEAPLQVEVAFELPAPRVSPQAVARAAAPAPQAPASQVEPSTPPMDREPAAARSGSLLASPWLWAGVGAVVAGGVVTAVLLAPAAKASPVAGDTTPPVISGRVPTP